MAQALIWIMGVLAIIVSLAFIYCIFALISLERNENDIDDELENYIRQRNEVINSEEEIKNIEESLNK